MDPERSKRPWPDEEARKQDEERTRHFLLDRGIAPDKVEEMLRVREATWHRHRVIAEERKRTKTDYGAFFAEVLAIITRHDPMGVVYPEAPLAGQTEYEPETGTIIPRLQGVRTIDDVQRIIDEEFDRWFWAGVSQRPRAPYQAIAEEIWAAWNRFSPGGSDDRSA